MTEKTKVRRYDLGELKKPEITSQGFLKADGLATRTGVFTYFLADGTIVKELRMPEEVFDPDSMATLSEIPVTNDHPPVSVNSENAKDYSVGFTGQNVDKLGNFLKVRTTITDIKAIKDVTENGKIELSCGYDCFVIPQKGVYNGESYDAIQTEIKYNHLAIVQQGRAGPMAKLALDSNSQDKNFGVMQRKNDSDKKTVGEQDQDRLPSKMTVQDNEQNGVKKMKYKFKIDGVEYETDDAAIAQAVTQKILSYETELKSLQDKADKAQGKCDSIAADLEKVKKEVLTQEKIDSLVNEKIAVKEKALKILPEEKFDGLSTLAIKKKVVSVKNKIDSIDSKTEAYIDGAFDSIEISVVDDKRSGQEKEIAEAHSGKDKKDSALALVLNDRLDSIFGKTA